jgi:hypothetical protein
MAGKKAAAGEQKVDKLPLSFYFWQHIGFVICSIFVFLLAYYYEEPPIGNKTHWCIVCLGGCVVGLLFHEFRPFKVSLDEPCSYLQGFDRSGHAALCMAWPSLP